MTQGKSSGLKPLAWIAIGCVGLIVVGGIIMVAGGMFVAKKAKDALDEHGIDLQEMAADFEANPAKAAAKAAIAIDDNLELVSTDDEAGTITFRNIRKDEEITLDWEDVQRGKFSVTTSEGTTTIDASGAQDGSGVITTRSSDGTETRIGGVTADEMPDWVPRYPRTDQLTPGYASSSNDGSVAGSYQFTTRDGLDQVRTYFRTELEAKGFVVQSPGLDANLASLAIIVASKQEGNRSFNLQASRDGDVTTGNVSFTAKGQ